MPARKNLSPESIKFALAHSGGGVSAAAHALGISPRTLQRRLREDPTLRPVAFDHRWETAFANRNAITDCADDNLFNPNAAPWSRYKRHVGWNEDTVELAPRVLEQEEVYKFARALSSGNVFRVRPKRRVSR